MNFTALRYIIAVEQYGSLSQAARELYISQSSLSRAISEIESQIGISLFQRTNKGVIPTHDGLEFMAQARQLLFEMDQLKQKYFQHDQHNYCSLRIISQRCHHMFNAFLWYYQKHCSEFETLDFVLQEAPPDQVMRSVVNRTFSVGILHYTNDQEANFIEKCKSLDLEYHLVDSRPIAVQVRPDHPLTQYESITSDMLFPYPHIAYSDESVTNVNYCSDITQYNPIVHKKRIVVNDRGAMHRIVDNTDGYYIGGDYSRLYSANERNPKFVRLTDVDLFLETVWIKRSNSKLASTEEQFVSTLSNVFNESEYM